MSSGGRPVARRTLLLGAAAAATASCDLSISTSGSATTHAHSHRMDGTLTSVHLAPEESAWSLLMPMGKGSRALVIGLHGKGSNGPEMMDMLALDEHVARTELAVATISGGDTYWHKRRSGVDAGAMVMQDFLPLMRSYAKIPESTPLGFLGFSMGGYGSLLLASAMKPATVLGVVAQSAALWTDPGDSAEGAFDDREDFVAHNVFRRAKALSRIPIRLDCGTDDPFIAANRAFARDVVPHAVTNFDAGGHTGDYWRSHAGADLDWLAAQLS